LLALQYLPIKVGLLHYASIFPLLLSSLSAIILFGQGGVYEILAMAFFLLAIYQPLPPAGHHQSFELRLFIITSVIVALLEVANQHATVVWHSIRWLSAGLNTLCGLLISSPVEFGITYQGLKIAISFIIFAAILIHSATTPRISAYCALIFFIIMGNVIYIIASYFFSPMYALFLPTFFPQSHDSQWALFVLLLPILFMFQQKIWIIPKPAKALPPMALFISAILVLTLIIGHSRVQRQTHAHVPPFPILFHDEGYLDWNKPTFKRYGGKQGGMFGILRQYLKAKGHRVDTGKITDKSLDKVKCLVLINLNRTFTPKEVARVWHFVDQGGSLLVLGDHTGREHIRMPFNALLKRINIAFNFDSAVPLIEAWARSLAIRPHDITRDIHDENDLQIGIGASLKIGYRAAPIIIGQRAFGDRGDLAARQKGFLGDLQFTSSEKLGDLVLMAATRYGRGKVLVCGDTAPFQNSSLVLSAGFVDRVFDWLGTTKDVGYVRNEIIFKLLLTLGLLSWLYHRSGSHLVANALYALCVVAYLAANLGLSSQKPMTKALKASVAYIDISHMERVSLDLWGAPEGFGGLTYNLIRNGYLPLAMKKFEPSALSTAELLVIIAPAKPFTKNQIDHLDRFVGRGGLLILSAGWQEKAPLAGLLRRFNLDLKNIPLGSNTTSAAYGNVRFADAWAVAHQPDNVRVLCRLWDYPVCVYQRWRQGGILLVGDASFLLNKNLEGLYRFSLPNIFFLSRCLSQGT
jgi:hypothetical protein